jgi:hypothetical protein
MNAVPQSTSLCDLPTFRTWCRQTTPSQQTVQASPAPGVSGATVTGTGTGLQIGRSIAITLGTPTVPANAGTYLVGLLTNAAGALTWTPPLPEAPKTGDVVADANFDADAVVIIDGVSAWLESLTNRIYHARTITDTFSGKGDVFRKLKYRPVASVVTVQIDDQPTLLTASDYWTDPDFGVLYLKTSCFRWGIGNCQVVYTTALEGTIKGQAYLALGLDLMKVIWDRVQNGTLTIASLSAGPFGTSIRPGLPDTLKMQLAAFVDTRGLL